jgi:hypothetical protein
MTNFQQHHKDVDKFERFASSPLPQTCRKEKGTKENTRLSQHDPLKGGYLLIINEITKNFMWLLQNCPKIEV